MDVGFFNCTKCDKVFKNELGLTRHLNRHGISIEIYILDKKYNNIRPLCKCGCNQETKYGPELRDYRDYAAGHKARVKNNFNTEKSINNSKKTRAKQKQLGLLIGKDSEETRKKKSESHKGEKNHMFGKTHSDATREILSQKGKEYFANNPEAKKANGDRSRAYWSLEDSKIKQSLRQTQYLLDNNLFKPSGLESKFCLILEELDIEYQQQFRVNDGVTNGVFDFKIKDRNILIEVDGDFWHCNPVLHPTPIHKVQLRNIDNDKRKNQLALSQNYNLYRFWETDIKNSPEIIKKQLKNIIK